MLQQRGGRARRVTLRGARSYASSLCPLLPPRAGKYRSTDAAKGAPFVWLTGPSGVRQLVWLSPKPGLASGLKLVFELSSLAPALDLDASFSSSYKQSAVRIVGSAGWNDGVDVQFPAALRIWESVSPALTPLLTIHEATRLEAQHMLDANAALGKKAGGAAGGGGGGGAAQG